MNFDDYKLMMDKVIIFKITETHTKEVKWPTLSSKTVVVSYESFRFMNKEEEQQIREYICNKYYMKLSDTYNADYTSKVVDDNMLKSVKTATHWEYRDGGDNKKD